ncbi:MAG: FtsX-like permease family protein [Bacteroidales bacterium]|nr:FtsX-like permease family protein [Bacteroidales bacterium]
MIWSVSWRNVWRSRLRSLIIIAAIALGLFAGVFSVAFMIGWMNQRVETVVETETSHIQLHKPEYLKTKELTDNISNASKIRQQIIKDPRVKHASSRVIAEVMISSAETGSGVQLLGVNRKDEIKVSNLHEKIVKGSYLKEMKRSKPIVIGAKLAEKLKVDINSRVAVRLTDSEGTLTGGSFRVGGIYQMANTQYEEMKAFCRASDLRELVKLDKNTGHEIAVYLNQNGMAPEVASYLKTQFDNLEILTWKKLQPDMELMTESMDFMMYIFVGIILLALGFGIVNTMLMVILERVKELGMLMAIGMNKARVYTMIVLETVFLSLTGGVIGIVIAVIVTALTHQTGIDLSIWAEGLNAYGFDAIVYPELTFEAVIEVTGLVIAVGIIAALYPAYKAIKLNPAEALRTDI